LRRVRGSRAFSLSSAIYFDGGVMKVTPHQRRFIFSGEIFVRASGSADPVRRALHPPACERAIAQARHDQRRDVDGDGLGAFGNEKASKTDGPRAT
jgi:hypothetical protein